jgi:hypothetical protein
MADGWPLMEWSVEALRALSVKRELKFEIRRSKLETNSNIEIRRKAEA